MGIWFVVGAFCATAFGVVFLQGDAQILAMVLTLCPVMLAPAASSRLATWIMARRRTVFLAAALLFALGVAAMAATLVLTPAADAYIPLAIWPFVLATAVAFLPNTARRMQSARALKDLPPPPAGAIRLGVRDELWRSRGALARIAAPWFLVFCLPILAVAVLASMQPDSSRASGWAVLFMCLILVGPYGAPLIAAVRWARHLAGLPAAPWWAIPGRAVFGVIWRLVLFGGVSRVATDVGKWLDTHVVAAAWVQSAAVNGLTLALLVLLSPLALVFAPVALEAEDKSIDTVMRSFGGRRRRFYIGAAGVVAPLTLTWWLLDVVQTTAAETLAGTLIQLGLWSVAWFVTVIVASTALTRFYLATCSDVLAFAPTTP